ncbi:hypothetical protein N7527_009065, partial [Penicillium freii]
SSTKRETILPGQLWSQKGDTSVKISDLNASAVNEDTRGQISPPKRVFEKTRLGIPVKASQKNISLAISKKSSLDKYHKSYNIDQARRAVIALKDTENLPVSNIGECLLNKHTSITVRKDIQDVGSMIVFLSDRTISLLESNNGLDMPSLSRLAHLFVQKTKEDTTVEQLVNVSTSDFCFVLWHG